MATSAGRTRRRSRSRSRSRRRPGSAPAAVRMSTSSARRHTIRKRGLRVGRYVLIKSKPGRITGKIMEKYTVRGPDPFRRRATQEMHPHYTRWAYCVRYNSDPSTARSFYASELKPISVKEARAIRKSQCGRCELPGADAPSPERHCGAW